MIDTHSHLLPGVDHGCPDLETSVRMARAALQSGIHTVFCTPHLSEWVPGQVDQAHQVIEQVREALEEAGIGLRLLMGFEVDLTIATGCSPEEIRPLCVEGSQGAIVLEMPYQGWPRFLEETIFRLAAGGLHPVLAHPERNDCVQRSPGLIAGCLRAGAVVQATVASLTGEFGKAPERTFHKLLAEGHVGLLASDAHAYRTDGWTLTPILERLRGFLSDEDLAALVQENPRRLLAGEPLRRVRAHPAHSSRASTVLRKRGGRSQRHGGSESP